MSLKNPEREPEVIIAGAGPVGSVLALSLAQRNIAVTLLEQAPAPPVDLRASTFHPPSLEMIAGLGDGVLEEMLARGLKVDRYQYRDRVTGEVAEFRMQLIADETPYPYRLQLEQYELTRIIADRLASYSCVDYRFNSRVSGFDQDDDGVRVHIEAPEGEETIGARFLAGCDGAGSQVRKSAQINYAGFTYDEKFLVVSADFPFEDVFDNLSWVNYISDPEEWCVILRTDKIWRVLFPTAAEDSDDDLLGDTHIQERLQRLYRRNENYRVRHRTLYRVHQRVAETYFRNRVALAGDAAHINNPLGGMGMNGGLHDAFNLADKLARIIGQGQDHVPLFEQYDRQRRRIAVDFIQRHTIDNKKLMEAKEPDAQRKRQQALMAAAADPQRAREFIMERAMFHCLRDSLKEEVNGVTGSGRTMHTQRSC